MGAPGGDPYQKVKALFEHASEQIKAFSLMPAEVRSVVKSGSYDVRFCRRFNGQRFVVHSEEVLPQHHYQFVVLVVDGAVRLGWRWAFVGSPSKPFGPRWLYDVLCDEGENPQEKLNGR